MKLRPVVLQALAVGLVLEQLVDAEVAADVAQELDVAELAAASRRC